MVNPHRPSRSSQREYLRDGPSSSESLMRFLGATIGARTTKALRVQSSSSEDLLARSPAFATPGEPGLMLLWELKRLKSGSCPDPTKKVGATTSAFIGLF